MEIKSNPRGKNWTFDILLLLVLLAGLYLRLVGYTWDEGQYLHPDERFLMFVESSIRPVESLSEYFNTEASSLNPHNSGHPLFVYGTAPIFFVRYLLEWLDISGGDVYRIGRPLSALANLTTVFLVYLVGTRAYDRRVGLIAAAFSAFSVLDIQLSHFFKEDTFVTLFVVLALYFAVRIAYGGSGQPRENEPALTAVDEPTPEPSVPEMAESEPSSFAGGSFSSGAALQTVAPAANRRSQISGSEQIQPAPPAWRFQPEAALFLLFGLALALAVASKLNGGLIALALPVAVLIRISRLPARDQPRAVAQSILYLAIAAFVSLLAFRVLQPYAFQGPGFFGLRPNPKWLSNIAELRRLTSPDSVWGFPPSLQWDGRAIFLFAWENVVRWGLGLPLGLLAWAGFAAAGWRMIRGEWQRHALIWGWTAIYFAWQSSVFNPTMRYQLPVYPTLTILGAWLIVYLWDRKPVVLARGRITLPTRALALVLAVGVLLSTSAWAFAFSRIYTRPVTRVEASRWMFENIPGAINLRIETGEGQRTQLIPYPENFAVRPGVPYTHVFTARQSGELVEIFLPKVRDLETDSGAATIRAQITPIARPDTAPSTADVMVDLAGTQEAGQPVSLIFNPGLAVLEEETYQLELTVESAGNAALTIDGAALAHESTWDDGLPMRLDGYDPYGGIYRGGLNFEMYWDDTPDKYERFINTLDQADYLVITSSRQWGSVGRLPGRFPLSTTYYRALMGCPAGESIESCFNRAQVGTFQGQLGFELIQVFQSDPSIGPISFNDQASEEAFTVYDHPKVLIFEKSLGYDTGRAREILGAVDLSRVVGPDAPRAEPEKTLLLPEARLNEQRQGGTWTDLFDSRNLVNRFESVGVAVWYLSVLLVGLIAYPILRIAVPGLEDGGYPLSRIAGLLMLSYLTWLAGSFRIPFGQVTITAALALLALVSLALVLPNRHRIRDHWRRRSHYYLSVEAVFLALFLVGILIRLGNPDLWHPWKGGEKPMDFSYFNAVLKSTSFPPYDPWYAGGYINYYYYGFVFVGVLVKWLGIIPSIAYNLILPTLFALIGLGAFSVGWNLFQATASRHQAKPQDDLRTSLEGPHAANTGEEAEGPRLAAIRLAVRPSAWLAGLSATLGMVVLGNLGIIRMIVRGYQRLAAGGVPIDEAGLLSRMLWTLQGFFKALSGSGLPYAMADWYWLPSRAIPAPGDVEPITEFPFFTFLYADLHAHLIALPLTVLVIAWALSVVLAKGRWQSLAGVVSGLLIGGLTIGALRPTNTWDFYPFLAVGVLAMSYTALRYAPTAGAFLRNWPARWPGVRFLLGLGGAGLLILLSHVLFQPYADWYGQGYNAADIWRGTHTPVSAYFNHWGVFLFAILSWMAWETREWMAQTPLSALRRLAPYQGLIQMTVVLLAVATAVLMLFFEVRIAWVVLPLAAWAGVLLLKPRMPDAKRVTLFLVGTGLTLSLMVEVIVLRGDIGRMNTVFKFYLQTWTLFAVSAAGALSWLVVALPRWAPNWRRVWQIGLAVLVASASLYPLFGGLARIKDRMTSDAPHTLDGMAYMAYSTYNDLDTQMELEQDYNAIRWLQEHVVGSPVIVEGNMVEYHWGTRFSIYTGLPGVVGWNWHQRQQRALQPSELVTDRVQEIERFYRTDSPEEARAFLDKYDVRFIILGQLERAYYAGDGLSKFDAWNGIYWHEVFRDRETVIYEVIGSETAASS